MKLSNIWHQRIYLLEFSMLKILEDLIILARERKSNPVEGSYTNKLLQDKTLVKEKVLEEIKELIEAVDQDTNKIHEAADVLYHLIIYFEKNAIKIEDEVLKELNELKYSENQIKRVLPFKIFQGNKPSNSILINKLTPKSLGKLICLYEHKIFVQGIIWNIFSFDQWGVELGKELANNILNEIQSDIKFIHDESTKNLIEKFKNNS